MIATHRPPWRSRGWMSFTVAAGAHLRLGGSTPTAPTLALSGGKNETDPTCFLVAGIPQDGSKSRFAEPEAIREGSAGHTIKHAIYEIVSGGTPANAAAARVSTDGSVPTATRGKKRVIADERTIDNSRDEIYNFDLLNNTDGNMVVEVEVFE